MMRRMVITLYALLWLVPLGCKADQHTNPVNGASGGAVNVGGGGGEGGGGDMAAGGMAAGVGGTGGAGGSLRDISTCPSDLATAVATNTVIRINAAVALDPSLVFSVDADGQSVTGAVAVSGQTATFTAPAFAPGTVVQVGVTGAQVNASWSFTVGDDPAYDEGFSFDPPEVVPNGDHGPSPTIAMNGDKPVLAWWNGTTGNLFLLNVTATGFGTPFPFFGPSSLVEQIDLSIRDNVIHVAGSRLFALPAEVLYFRIDGALTTPPDASWLMAYGGYIPKVAAGDGAALAYAFGTNSAYWSPSGARVLNSSDNGTNFPNLPTMMEAGAMSPDVHYQGSRLIVAWRHNDRIRMATSEDSGGNYSPIFDVALPPDAQTDLGVPSIVDNHQGELWIVWQETKSGFTTTRARLLEAGTGTLGATIEIAPTHANLTCSRVVAAPNGEVVAWNAYEVLPSRKWDISVRRSYDGGHSYGAPVVLDVEMERPCPALAFKAGTPDELFAVYQTSNFEVGFRRGREKRPCE